MEKTPPLKSQLYVRVVRCPRCARLLAEPTDVPLYGCGGCGTLLQAKHYKIENERRTSSDDSSGVQNDESNHNLHAGEGEADSSSPQHYEEHNLGIDLNAAQSGKLDQQLQVSSSSDEVSSSNQAQAQPQSASLSSQDTNEASYSNELACLTLKDPSISLEQNEIVVEEQIEATDSSSQATTISTTTNQEMDVQVLQIESGGDTNEVNSFNKEELQLVEALEEKNTNGSLNFDKIEETRYLHKSQMRKSSTYDGSVSSYEAEYPISEDSKSEEYYKGWKNKNYMATQRTPSMLHVIDTPPQHMRRVPTKERGARLHHLYKPNGFSTSMDGRMFPVLPYYDSSQETYPHVFTESEYYSEDQEMSRFHLKRKSQNARRILPMIGAAPFVTCYKCLELLELPLEFIVLKTTRRRSYRLKCSTCSSDLEFTVLDEKGCGRQLVPCISESRDRDGETQHAQDKGKSNMEESQSYEKVKRSGLSLHRLMGYATPSAMFDGYD